MFNIDIILTENVNVLYYKKIQIYCRNKSEHIPHTKPYAKALQHFCNILVEIIISTQISFNYSYLAMFKQHIYE